MAMNLQQMIICIVAGGVVAQAAWGASSDQPPPPPPPGNGMPMPPPGGMGPGGMPPPPQAKSYKLRGLVTVGAGKHLVEKARKYVSGKDDTSALYVKDGGKAELDSARIETHGNTSSDENSSFFGLNAGVLVTAGSSARLTDAYIVTTGSGANGLFATGRGARLVMHGGDVVASGDGGHGVMTSLDGEAVIEDVRMRTSGAHAAPIATDRGGGRVSVRGGTFLASGEGSPGIYSTGDIQVQGAVVKASGSEAAVIEGQNSIDLTDTRLSGARLAGVMIYQSFSGDAQGHQGTFRMRGGSLTAEEGPVFFVTNAAAQIELDGVQVAGASGLLVKAGPARWGQQGSNGGEAHLLVRHQTLQGDLLAESGSAVILQMESDSRLRGRIDGGALELDASSQWEVTGPSRLLGFKDAVSVEDGAIPNVIGNGYTVHYDASSAANAALAGKTYRLAAGGVLTPD